MLLEPLTRRNRYFVLRHGESIANVQGIIVSDPAVGCSEYGLSERGKSQLRGCVTRYRETMGRLAVVVSSDFRRARETAEIVASGRACNIELNPLLRERFFGDWNGTSNRNYEQVWSEDRLDAEHTRWNVESVSAVAERVAEVVRECEGKFSAMNVLLVSHGDPLQILECLFHGKPPGLHRDLAPLQPGELRSL